MNSINMAIISFDGVHLLLPQQAVASIEMTTSIVGGGGANIIGKLKTSAGEWPAYALRADFTACDECPARYRYCVAVIRDNRPAFAIACEEVGSVSIVGEDQIKPLQTPMRVPGQPIEGVMLSGNKLLLASNVELLQRYLAPRAAA